MNATKPQSKQNQVKMNVYFEAQDSESTRFFKEQLLPLKENGLLEHIDLKMVPSGRATCDAAHQEYE